jgi:hypothetical protein
MPRQIGIVGAMLNIATEIVHQNPLDLGNLPTESGPQVTAPRMFS